MAEEKPKYKFETLAVHGGYQDVEESSRSRQVPIYQTTSYTFKDDKHAADLFALKEFGNIYTRIMNPTTDVLEKRIAELEGGVAALALSSGMSAETIAIMTICNSGDHIVSSSEIYGGTYTLLNYTLRRFGVDTDFVDPSDPENFRSKIKPNTKALYVETLGNPRLRVPNFEAIAKIAHENDIPLIVDNTFASPYLCNPIKWGADIVVHSTTKYISGHGNAIGGVIIDSGNFPWGESPRFKWFNQPDPSYHGLNFHETFGNLAFIIKARVQLLRDVGAAPSPFNSWLTLIGLETLPIRMDRTCSNALKIAEYLSKHEKVEWVNYPAMLDGEWKKLLDKYLPKGASGMIGFEIKGGLEAGKKLINSVKLLSHLANVGDAKSLIIHPASTTHQQLTSDEQEAAGITQGFIRLSIGIENVDDLIADLDQAFKF